MEHHFNGEREMIGLGDSRCEILQDAGGRGACGRLGVDTYVVDLATLSIADECHKAGRVCRVGVGGSNLDDVKHVHEMDEGAA